MVAVASLGAVLLLLVVACWRPKGSPAPGADTLDVTYVQGGGPQGTRAIDTDPHVVFERHLDATRRSQPGRRPGRVARERGRRRRVRDQPRTAAGRGRGGAPRRADPRRGHRGRARRARFLNAQVVVLPDGRREQPLRQGAPRAVRRVHAAARADRSRSARRPTRCPATPRPGTGPAVLDTPDGRWPS